MENRQITVTVKVQRLASARDLPLPARATALCAGMDLRAAVDHDVRIDPGTTVSVPTGLRIAVPPGFEAQVRPRSGLALKDRILVPNSPGTIDADYRGEVAVILFNGGSDAFVVRRGDRIAQMVVKTSFEEIMKGNLDSFSPQFRQSMFVFIPKEAQYTAPIDYKQKIIEYSKDITTGFDQPPVLVYLEDTVGMYAQKKMFVFGMAEYVGQMTISSVKITMVTTYDGLTGFINEVTQNDYIVNVTEIEANVMTADVDPNEQTEETVPDPAADGETSGDPVEAAPVQEVPPVADEYASEGVELVANSKLLLQVTLTLEIYTMAGEVPSSTVYTFDDNSYIYGGDIFY